MDSASHLFWITGGGLSSGSWPDFAIVSGVSRVVMLEQPAMKFLTIDVDDTASHLARTTENILSVLSQGTSEDTLDFEIHPTSRHASRKPLRGRKDAQYEISPETRLGNCLNVSD